MLNRLFSQSATQPQAGGAAAFDDQAYLHELLGDGPEPEVLPDYVVEVPRDVRRDEYVTLTLEERTKFVRPEETIDGRGLRDELADSVGSVVDRLVLDPVRLVLGNLGFMVTGAAVLALVTMLAVWIIDLIMAPFAPIGG